MNDLTEHEMDMIEKRADILRSMRYSDPDKETRIAELREMLSNPPPLSEELQAMKDQIDAHTQELTAPPKVVAFTGLRFSGKSTAAKILIEQHDYVDVKFADPLKNMLRAFYKTCGIDEIETERRLEGDLKEVPCKFLLGKTPRFAMQTLGTEWRDLMGPHMWSDITKMRIENGSCGKRVVVSDYRFKHEAKTLDELGALKIRIVGNKTVDDEAATHLSETTILEVPEDVVLYNNGTIEYLQERVLEAVRAWEGV